MDPRPEERPEGPGAAAGLMHGAERAGCVLRFDEGLVVRQVSGPFSHLCRVDEPLGRTLRDALDPEIWGGLVGAISIALSGQRAVRRLESEPYILDAAAAPVRDAIGAVVGGELVLRIVDRMAVPLPALSDERILTYLELAPDGVVIVGADGRILNVNPRLEALFGYGRSELIGRPVEMLVPVDRRVVHAGRRTEYTHRPRERGMGAVASLRGRRRDGSLFPVDISLAPMDLGDGRTVIAAGVRDLSARVAAEEEAARTERRVEAMVDVSPDVVMHVDPGSGEVTYCSPSARDVFGREPAELLGHGAWSLIHPDDLERASEAGRRATSGAGVEVVEVRFGHADGSWVWAEASILGVRGADGRIEEIYVASRDIADRRRARELRAQWELTLDMAPIGMAIVGLSGEFLRVNRAFAEMLGYGEADLLGMHVEDVTHPDDLAADRSQATSLLAGRSASHRLEKRFVGADGRVIWVLVSAGMLQGEEDAPVRMITQVVDITERKSMEAQLHHLADHDELTGLMNRRRFASELRRQVERCRDGSERAVLITLDIDEFKDVNDTLGHAAGDELLRHLARTIEGRLRQDDAVARLGGDEFALLVRDIAEEDALALAEELCRLIAEAPLELDEEPVHISVSAGVTRIDSTTTSDADALIDADVAMYEAKDLGRNRVVAASDAGRSIAGGLAWSRRIRSALRHDGFVLHAQPIVDLRTGRTVIEELLLRMRDEDGRLIPPGAFLRSAERLGFIRPIDRWVLGSAAAHAAARPEKVFAVNISASSLVSPGFGDLVERELARAGCRPDQLVVEVTETTAIANMQTACALADRLRGLGCRVALDDFGAGFSSLAHLKELPIDILKLDGAFVRGLADDPADQLIVRAVATVARGLGGMEVVAEHVETARDAEKLLDLGVGLAQGYHFGRPEPVDPGPAPAADRGA